MRRGREARAKWLLQGISVPDEVGAQERAWAVAHSAYVGRLSVPPRRSRLRFVPVPALLLGIAVILELTPAGAAVRRLINSALSVRNPTTSLVISLPARGSRLLVTAPGGTWIVKDHGDKRRLGQWDVATWSPRGLYLATADAHRLAAINPAGVVVWSTPVEHAHYLRWFEPAGSYNSRISFISGSSLWIVTGDNMPRDRASGAQPKWIAAARVAQVGAAWRPGSQYELVYASASRQIVSIDDIGRRVWTTRRMASAPMLLAFSGDGSRLLVLSKNQATVLNGAGQPLGSVTAAPGQQFVDGALSSNGHTLALLSDRTVTLVDWQAGRGIQQAVFTTRLVRNRGGLRQLAWSPDGQWLLATWPSADEWVFIHATGAPTDQIVSHVSEQFRGVFPQIGGWCCT
ncbi:MAG TPA: hypothetical protein VIX82_09190 [Solirubrobacteraceae bacterium]